MTFKEVEENILNIWLVKNSVLRYITDNRFMERVAAYRSYIWILIEKLDWAIEDSVSKEIIDYAVLRELLETKIILLEEKSSVEAIRRDNAAYEQEREIESLKAKLYDLTK